MFLNLQEFGLFYLVSTSLSKLLNAACFWRWIDHSLIKQEGVLFLSLFLLLNKSHTSVYLSNCTYFKKKKEGALYTTTWKLGINMCEKNVLGTIHILGKHIFRIFGHPISMFLVLRICKKLAFSDIETCLTCKMAIKKLTKVFY